MPVGLSAASAGLLPGVRTVFYVEQLAALAPVSIFTLSGRFFGGGIQFRHPLELSTAIRVLGVILRFVANGLSGLLGFHFRRFLS